MKTPDKLFETLWADYATINPQARAIHQALAERGEKVINDHVAFRTFSFGQTCIEKFARPFLECGYQFHPSDYHFAEKKLKAKHLVHKDPDQPKVFISQIEHESFSPTLKSCLNDCLRQIPKDFMQSDAFLTSGALWQPISFQLYEKLLAESEYAAWLAVFGFRVNHFTVSFNHLKTFSDLYEFNQFIRNLGYALNISGGEVKGTPASLLEQSSTLAYPVQVCFSDQEHEVPGCYYEFARRYATPDGKLFQGFVPTSADKLFESTDNT